MTDDSEDDANREDDGSATAAANDGTERPRFDELLKSYVDEGADPEPDDGLASDHGATDREKNPPDRDRDRDAEDDSAPPEPPASPSSESSPPESDTTDECDGMADWKWGTDDTEPVSDRNIDEREASEAAWMDPEGTSDEGASRSLEEASDEGKTTSPEETSVEGPADRRDDTRTDATRFKRSEHLWDRFFRSDAETPADGPRGRADADADEGSIDDGASSRDESSESSESEPKRQEPPEPSPDRTPGDGTESTPARTLDSERDGSRERTVDSEETRLWDEIESSDENAPSTPGDTAKEARDAENGSRRGDPGEREETDPGREPSPARSEVNEAETRPEPGGHEGTRPRRRGSSFDGFYDEISSGDDRSKRSRPGEASPRDPGERLEKVLDDLDEFDRATSGSQVLVISPIEHSITRLSCSHFLSAGEASGKNVLFVTLNESAEDRLQVCAEAADWSGGEIVVVEIGTSRSEPSEEGESYEGNPVEVKHVSSPRNLSKLGVLISHILSEWKDSDRPTVVCVHSLTDLLGYVQTEQVFQFLHIFTSQLNALGISGHFHLDSNAHDDQTVRTLEEVFDLTIRISARGDVDID